MADGTMALKTQDTEHETQIHKCSVRAYDQLSHQSNNYTMFNNQVTTRNKHWTTNFERNCSLSMVGDEKT